MRPGVHLLHTSALLHPHPSIFTPQHGGSGRLSVQTVQLQTPAHVPHPHRVSLHHLAVSPARKDLQEPQTRRLLLFPSEGHEGEKRLTGEISGESKFHESTNQHGLFIPLFLSAVVKSFCTFNCE